jgi:glycerophosphoryl diester phosphodiesterase
VPVVLCLDRHAEFGVIQENAFTLPALDDRDAAPQLRGHHPLTTRAGLLIHGSTVSQHRTRLRSASVGLLAYRPAILGVVTRLGPSTGFAFLDHDGPIPFAHRGGAKYAPNLGLENTMAAFQAAIDLGYRYLETDVHATVDGVLLAFHDRRLNRTTNGRGRIAGMTYAQVQNARVNGTETIPTLAAVLTTWPQVRLNIDVKHASAIDPLVSTVNALRAHERVCIGSFSQVRLNRVRARLGPSVATSFGPLSVASLRLIPLDGLRQRLLATNAPCIQAPRAVGRFVFVDETFVARAHQFGKHVHAWTVDDEADIVRLLDLGVDGIITDRIDTLRDVLVARGEWRPAPDHP